MACNGAPEQQRTECPCNGSNAGRALATALCLARGELQGEAQGSREGRRRGTYGHWSGACCGGICGRLRDLGVRGRGCRKSGPGRTPRLPRGRRGAGRSRGRGCARGRSGCRGAERRCTFPLCSAASGPSAVTVNTLLLLTRIFPGGMAEGALVRWNRDPDPDPGLPYFWESRDLSLACGDSESLSLSLAPCPWGTGACRGTRGNQRAV